MKKTNGRRRTVPHKRDVTGTNPEKQTIGPLGRKWRSGWAGSGDEKMLLGLGALMAQAQGRSRGVVNTQGIAVDLALGFVLARSIGKQR